MYQVIIVVHVLLGLGVVGLILMQQGKGADAGAAFGSGSSGSVFGAQGAASFLSRTTAILAALFFSTSLGLAVLSGYQEGEVDLMDAPETEIFADVPLIKGAEESATDNVPDFGGDVPVAIDADGSTNIDTVTEEVLNQIKKVEEQVNDTVENAQPIVNE